MRGTERTAGEPRTMGVVPGRPTAPALLAVPAGQLARTPDRAQPRLGPGPPVPVATSSSESPTSSWCAGSIGAPSRTTRVSCAPSGRRARPRRRRAVGFRTGRAAGAGRTSSPSSGAVSTCSSRGLRLLDDAQQPSDVRQRRGLQQRVDESPARTRRRTTDSAPGSPCVTGIVASTIGTAPRSPAQDRNTWRAPREPERQRPRPAPPAVGRGRWRAAPMSSAVPSAPGSRTGLASRPSSTNSPTCGEPAPATRRSPDRPPVRQRRRCRTPGRPGRRRRKPEPCRAFAAVKATQREGHGRQRVQARRWAGPAGTAPGVRAGPPRPTDDHTHRQLQGQRCRAARAPASARTRRCWPAHHDHGGGVVEPGSASSGTAHPRARPAAGAAR